MNAPIPESHPRVDFIRIEVLTGLTLVKLAQTERQMLETAAADRAIGLARDALRTVRRFLPALPVAAEVRDGLQQKVETLETAIYRYENLGNPAAG